MRPILEETRVIRNRLADILVLGAQLVSIVSFQ